MNPPEDEQNPRPPVVLSFSGHDPCGGAGIQADIETLISHGCHSASVITCLTVQNTRDVYKLLPISERDILEQAEALLDDLPVDAIKIGLLGGLAAVHAIEAILNALPDIPVVLDPVLSSGGSGAALVDESLLTAIRTRLLPKTTLVTPNRHEALQLAEGADSIGASGHALLSLGADYALITGADDDLDEPVVTNSLYGGMQFIESFNWDRLPGEFHGSGCTLASAAAALLAHGLDIFSAVHEAQEYTWNTLKAARNPGQWQSIPNRLFWANGDD